MRALENNKAQDVRIRNLLRQFTMIYLKNKNKSKFTLKDPGVGEKEFNLDNTNNIPSILEDLISFLGDKRRHYTNVKEYDVDIRKFIE